MKKSIFFIFLLISFFSFSQNGKIYPKSADIISGGLNTYIYEPPTGLTVPENAFINLFYMPWVNPIIPLIKKDINYEFTVAVPDSILFLNMTVTDQAKKIIDSNSDKGYVVYLKNRTKEELEKSKLSNLSYMGLSNYVLKINVTPEETISHFEELYTQNPALKEDDSYSYYLYLQYQKDNEKFKPAVIEYAEKLIKKGDEQSLLKASDIYSWSKMYDKCVEIEGIALKKYPKGQFAKNKFFKEYYYIQIRSEKFILDEMTRYSTEFNDTSVNSKKTFRIELLNVYLKNADTINIKKYSSLINNDILVASLFNNTAWQLSGQDLITPGKDLSFAESLSKQSIEIIKKAMNDSTKKIDILRLRDSFITYTDTYALIMYKRQKYDLAFQYQDEISKMVDIDTGGKERYAGYAEKAKGMEFAKTYIEKQIKAGVESKIMINQLQEIYKKLNLSFTDFEKIKENTLNSKSQKTKDQIIKKYGGVEAIDFTLTNMKGEKVKLSDYKGKVVILDFWATWCGPCRASFPKMQELVEKYKNRNVEFFFIDVWEKMSPADIKTNVAKFIKENKYSFNVLFDFKDEIVAKYKVEGIPTKIVIDKNGNMLTIESSMEDLSTLIDQNL
jgi:thiol-disulfide isomerase/thioredoxin